MAVIHHLKLAEVNLSGAYNPPTFRDSRIDVYATLIITSSATILVDTGVGSDNHYINKTFEPLPVSVEQALNEHGLQLADIDIVINSHLHFDHCGNNRLFPRPQFVIQEAEISIARSSRYTVNSWFDFTGADLHQVRGDKQIAPGVSVLSTPGHTPGHQSVLIEDNAGIQLIAAQAAFSIDEYQRGGDPEHQAHEGFTEDYVASIKRLKNLNAVQTFFSHQAPSDCVTGDN